MRRLNGLASLAASSPGRRAPVWPRGGNRDGSGGRRELTTWLTSGGKRCDALDMDGVRKYGHPAGF